MKNIVKIIGIITFVVLIGSSMIACKNDTDDDAPALVKYGELTVDGGGKIPIYKTATVTDAQMTALVGGLNVVARVQAGYDAMVSNKAKLNTTNVSAIHIHASGDGDAFLSGSKYIIRAGHSLDTTQMRSALSDAVTYDIP